MECNGEVVNRPRSMEIDGEVVDRHFVSDGAKNKFVARVPGTCVPIRRRRNRMEVRGEFVDRSNSMESS
jgi:hypothetical protein